MGRQGVSHEFLFPHFPLFATLAHLSFAAIGEIFSLLLTQSFFHYKLRKPLWRWLFGGLIALLAVTAMMPFIFGYLPASIVLTNISCISIVVLLAMSILASARGNRSAIFFTIAWIFHLLGGSTVVLRSWGLLSNPVIMDYGYQIGITFELFLISASIAYSLCMQRLSNQRSQEELLNSQKKAIHNLKKTVLSRIQLLQARINPDFLFNALNAISHQTRVNQESAEKSLGMLSSFYRTVLRFSQRSFVRLSEEMDMVDLYVQFEKERFGERISFSKIIACPLDEIFIPGLIIQPLVENAIEYGILPRVAGGHVSLSITKTDNTLVISVKIDSIGWLKSEISAISLESIKERLSLIYGEKHRFDIRETEFTTVTVAIPLQGTPLFQYSTEEKGGLR
jgi:sensor histidine kinase YesM